MKTKNYQTDAVAIITKIEFYTQTAQTEPSQKSLMFMPRVSI